MKSLYILQEKSKSRTGKWEVCTTGQDYVRLLQAGGNVWLWLNRFMVLHYLVELLYEIGRSNGSLRGAYTKSDEVVTNKERPQVRKAFRGWPVKHG
jgi:hypothetical protein